MKNVKRKVYGRGWEPQNKKQLSRKIQKFDFATVQRLMSHESTIEEHEFLYLVENNVVKM